MGQQSSPNDDLVIGVDGGGTKTVVWVSLLDESTDSRILGRGQSGPSNPRSVGFAESQSAIETAVVAALHDANRPQAPAAAAWLGIAGAGRPSEQTQLENWAKDRGTIAHRVHVSGDADPILAAASIDNWGIALICGTGSLAWGRNQKGEIARTGGLGHLIGDEGSAYAIAIAAIRNAMQSADGRKPATPLLDRFLHYFNAVSTENLIEILYSPTMTRDVIAGGAKIVFETSTDSSAATIISAAADQIAEMIIALARQLDLPHSGYPMAMAGSLLLNQDSYRQSILQRLTSVGVVPGSVTLVDHPVSGAVRLARKLVQTIGQ